MSPICFICFIQLTIRLFIYLSPPFLLTFPYEWLIPFSAFAIVSSGLVPLPRQNGIEFMSSGFRQFRFFFLLSPIYFIRPGERKDVTKRKYIKMKKKKNLSTFFFLLNRLTSSFRLDNPKLYNNDHGKKK